MSRWPRAYGEFKMGWVKKGFPAARLSLTPPSSTVRPSVRPSGRRNFAGHDTTVPRSLVQPRLRHIRLAWVGVPLLQSEATVNPG
jgi:hypothetical protein